MIYYKDIIGRYKPAVVGGRDNIGAVSSASRSGCGCLGNARGGSLTLLVLALAVTEAGLDILVGADRIIEIPFLSVSS